MAIDVVVLSKDETLGRMIELELGQKEFLVLKVKNFTSELSRISNEAKLAIIDLAFDESARVMRYFENVPCAYIGFEDEIPKALKNKELLHKQRLFTRPFYIEDMVEFVQKILGKRTMTALYEREESTPADELEINEASRKAYFKGEHISLTKREYELLLYLVKNRGVVCSRNDIFEKVWGFDYIGDTNVVDVYIRYLRQKIDEKFGVKLIVTARGAGYSIGI